MLELRPPSSSSVFFGVRGSASEVELPLLVVVVVVSSPLNSISSKLSPFIVVTSDLVGVGLVASLPKRRLDSLVVEVVIGLMVVTLLVVVVVVVLVVVRVVLLDVVVVVVVVVDLVVVVVLRGRLVVRTC